MGYSPIPEHIREPKIIDSLKDIFKEYEDMQINSIIPKTNRLDFVDSKLGKVPCGSVISYQQRQNTTNDPQIHINIDGSENVPAFDVPSLGNYYSFVPTLE